MCVLCSLTFNGSAKCVIYFNIFYTCAIPLTFNGSAKFVIYFYIFYVCALLTYIQWIC